MIAVNNFVFGNIWDWGNPFTIVVDTRNTISGGSADNEWKFPQNMDVLDGYINFMVYWGDGQFSRIQSKAEALVPHVYATPGIYTINFYKPKNKTSLIISPRYEYYANERNKILKVLRFSTNYNSSRSGFSNCPNLDFSELQDSEVTFGGAEGLFRNLTTLTTFGNLKKMTITISTLRTFEGCTNFNQPNLEIYSSWDSCYAMFNNNYSLTRLKFLAATNTNNVYSMFANCHAFNMDLVADGNISWDKITNAANFMTKNTSHAKYVAFNPLYYDKILQKFDEGGQTGVTLRFDSKYTNAGATYRANLIAKSWTITDLGLV